MNAKLVPSLGLLRHMQNWLRGHSVQVGGQLNKTRLIDRLMKKIGCVLSMFSWYVSPTACHVATHLPLIYSVSSPLQWFNLSNVSCRAAGWWAIPRSPSTPGLLDAPIRIYMPPDLPLANLIPCSFVGKRKENSAPGEMGRIHIQYMYRGYLKVRAIRI